MYVLVYIVGNIHRNESSDHFVLLVLYPGCTLV